MQDPPDWDRLVSDGREVERSLQRLRKRSEDVVEAGRLERTNLWSGKPRLAAGYRELAAEWRRCAALAASVGLRDTHGDGSTWLETAASCRQAAEAWEGIARLTAGWGWSFRVACQVDFERETGSRATFEVLGGTRITKRRRPREARRRECGRERRKS